MKILQLVLARFGLATLNVAVFFIEEGWIIAMVALLPFWLALIVVTALLSFFSISSTYLCGASNLSPIVRRWLDKKQKENEENRLIQWAIKVARGAVLISALIIAIIVSPTTAALLLHQAGLSQKRAYIIDVINSAVSGTIWCLIYGLGINIIKIAYEYVKKLIGG